MSFHVNAVRALDRPMPASPFDLNARAAFVRWAAWKRRQGLADRENPTVFVADPAAPSEAEIETIRERCLRGNMAWFRTPEPVDKTEIRALGHALGLDRLDHHLCADGDGITSLRVMGGKRRSEYIPYSDKPLSWHTDGYYNDLRRQIGGVILYCVQDAAEGGGNALLDPEWAYLLMRETEPDWVRALMTPDALTIPANVEDGVTIRPARTGPVFRVAGDGTLRMRYTARKRNVLWKDDAPTREAAAWLAQWMAGDDAPVVRRALRPGEGVISNNVLHNRSGFRDAPGAQRLVYRARYYDRVAGTGLSDLPFNLAPS